MAIAPSVRLGLSMRGGWSKAARILGSAGFHLMRAQQKALLQEAEFFRTKIVEGIISQAPGGKAFKPLSPYTVAMRTFLRIKSEKALIERGDLVRNIKIHKIDANTVFIGIMRGATGSDGRDLVNVGEIHEYGAGPFIIKLTPKMIKFLMVVFRKMHIPTTSKGHGAGFMVITIPARPFLQPIFDTFGRNSDVKARMEARVGKLLAGAWA